MSKTSMTTYGQATHEGIFSKIMSKFNPTPLEKKKIGELAKLGKAPYGKEKKKKTRIEEFEFKPGFEIPKKEPWGRGEIEFFPEQWKKPVVDAKLTFAMEMINKKHGVTLESRTMTGGDYVIVRLRGNPNMVRLTNSILHMMEVGDLIDLIEKEFGFRNSRESDKRLSKEKPTVDNRTASEKWADEWEKKHELGSL